MAKQDKKTFDKKLKTLLNTVKGQKLAPNVKDALAKVTNVVNKTKGKFTTVNVVQEIEKCLIVESLKLNDGNQRQTALYLGMPKSTLHDRIKAYKLRKFTKKSV